MRYFIVMDNYGLMSVLPSMVQGRAEVIFFMVENGEAQRLSHSHGSNHAIYDFSAISRFKISGQDRVLMHVHSLDKRIMAMKRIRFLSSTARIMLIDCPADQPFDADYKKNLGTSVGILPLQSVLKTRSDEKWHQIGLKKKVERMKEAVNPKKPLWILTQDDPDPDALASALALQALLGRNDRNAPIVTLKSVSRNENISMINILSINVRTVKPAALKRAPQLAMVDVQPSYFRFPLHNLKIVVDHHPVTADYKVQYKDLQVTYGATATIFTEYLLASEQKIDQRLATSLYYAIKTDTLLLGREVSKADFNAFAFLWPKTNHQQVSQMERPRLQHKEISVFVKALKEYTVKSGCIFVGLGVVPKDDIVPRMADFILQIGDAEFALVWGKLDGETTFSARSLTPLIHAGEVMHDSFGHLGGAGGHKSMARATMQTADLMKDFGARSLEKLAGKVQLRILRLVAAQKKERQR